MSPSLETVIDGTYQPLARPIFIYVNAKSLRAPEVKEFVEFYMKNAREAGEGSEVRAAARQGLRATTWSTSSKKLLGTKFGGENKVGLTIEN